MKQKALKNKAKMERWRCVGILENAVSDTLYRVTRVTKRPLLQASLLGDFYAKHVYVVHLESPLPLPGSSYLM